MSPDPRKPISLPKGTASGASPKPPEASPVGDGLKKTSGEEKKGKALVAYLSNALMLVFVGVALISFYLVAKELISIQRLTGEKESIRKQIAEGRQSLSNLVGEISRFEVEAKRAEGNATDLTEREKIIADEIKRANEKLLKADADKNNALAEKHEANVEKNKADVLKKSWQIAAIESSQRDKILKSDINASVSEKNRLNKEIRSLKAELTARKSELQQLEPEKIELAEVQEKIKKLQGMVAEVREKEVTLSGLQTQENFLAEQNKDIEFELAQDGRTKIKLDKEILSLQSQVKSATKEEEGIRDSIEKARGQLAGGNKRIEDKQKEIFTINARVQDLNSTKTSLEIQKSALEKQIDSLRSQQKILNAEKVRLEQGIEVLEEKKSALGNNAPLLEQAESNLKKARGERIKATEEATAATATRDRMIRENAGLETERQRLEGLKKKLLAEIGNLEREKKDLETPRPPQ
jgi:chromosome segregation ATPase